MCVSCSFWVEAEHIAMFHQMPNEREEFYAVLDFGESDEVHALEVFHGQFAGAYPLVAVPSNVSAVLDDVFN